MPGSTGGIFTISITYQLIIMKKILPLLILTAALMVAGCQKKADYLLGKTPDERLTEALGQYQDVLTQAPYGWKVVVYSKGLEATYSISSAFSYYMKFNDANFVTMYSDFDTLTSTVAKTSGYRLKALQRPSIEFDSYGYIHLPCDPDPAISKSPIASEGGGYGWGSDFEFSFADNASPDQLGDTIHLMGNFNHSPGFMVRATKAEMDAYNNQGLRKAMVLDRILNYYKKITLGSTTYEITPGTGSKSVFFKWLDGNGALTSSASTPYYVTLDGVYFLNPITAGSQTISSINKIVFDANTNTATVEVNGTAGTLAGAIASIKTDIEAPFRFWKYSVDQNTYYRSGSAFHVNGVDDFYGAGKYPNYYYMLYWAGVQPTYDAFAANVGGSIIGPAVVRPLAPYTSSPTASYFTTDGRIIFRNFASFGTNIAGATTSPFLTTIRTQIYIASGYYLVQIGPASYDMVSALDAKAWIRWEL
jgi:hypothetical protein